MGHPVYIVTNTKGDVCLKCGLNPKEGTEIGIEMGMAFSKVKIKLLVDLSFVHPIFWSFGFWYFGHFSCMIFFPFF